jgi:hypothetical protein
MVVYTAVEMARIAWKLHSGGEVHVGRSRRHNFQPMPAIDLNVVWTLNTVEHIERITQLIIDICGTPETVCGPVDYL